MLSTAACPRQRAGDIVDLKWLCPFSTSRSSLNHDLQIGKKLMDRFLLRASDRPRRHRRELRSPGRHWPTWHQPTWLHRRGISPRNPLRRQIGRRQLGLQSWLDRLSLGGWSGLGACGFCCGDRLSGGFNSHGVFGYRPSGGFSSSGGRSLRRCRLTLSCSRRSNLSCR
jgi:hypothetical protein